MLNKGPQKLNGEMAISSGTEFTIDTVNEWHMMSNFSAGVTNGLIAETGTDGAITVFADGGGGQVTVTSAGHGISEDDYISIGGTTSYNGLFQVTNVTTDTFEITDTWVANDATGTWHHGSHLVVPPGGKGDYKVVWGLSVLSAANLKVYEFTIIVGVTPQRKISRKIASGSDVGAMAGTQSITLADGDHVSFAVRNITDATNLTISDGDWNLERMQ